MERRRKPHQRLYFFAGILIGIMIIVAIEWGAKVTSTDKFCDACHVHPHSTTSWKTSPHYDNSAGIYVHCVECHLPPKDSPRYYIAKAVTGGRDVYSYLFKDKSKLDWEARSTVEAAVEHTFESSCRRCHQNLFPLSLKQKGQDAHLYYLQQKGNVNCLNCHLRVGHYSHEEQKAESYQVAQKISGPIYTAPARVDSFKNFVEFIPGTSVSFEMIAIPGGTFLMGSPEKEPFRRPDEGPQVEVEISPFWMGKTEVTWDEYEAFYAATATEGRSDTQDLKQDLSVDAITGPTPPYQPPDQNWGRGSRPAITMTHHAATVYCEWLSKITGKKYRLPTEAEWEYTARAGTQTPYFFAGDPRRFSSKGALKFLFKPDTTGIASYIVYQLNSGNKTQAPSFVKPNPFGLLNMLGNVREFCADWYAPDAYAAYGSRVRNPKGPETGTERVVRGGSFMSDAGDVRCAARDHTDSAAWWKTDPQQPKS
ncbi:MAG: SUMF1/EgtB/PvdO family nonheme iron enzyme, partial [candidate division KSB1 bacterium]|nr:SUMF1/EgtB/PvdO family nonheme iron enzyme [candidate division KSB1 bacterium]